MELLLISIFRGALGLLNYPESLEISREEVSEFSGKNIGKEIRRGN